MELHELPRVMRLAAGLFVGLATIAPALAESPTRAKLVRCGANSCLHLSGYRPSAAMIVRVGERDLAVEGDRWWQATIPLGIARAWPIARNYALPVALVDPDARTARTDLVALPPGSLGARTAIASLVVSAR